MLGPPQLSTFARSSSESSVDASATRTKSETAKPSTEIAQESEESPSKKEEQEAGEEEEESASPGGFSGFLQLLQAMSGGAARTQSSGDSEDGIQHLLTRLGIVPRTYFFISLLKSFLFIHRIIFR